MMSRVAQPFSLRQLQYAVAVADTLSFTRAAEACHVSQPSLSAQLALLEDVLGVRLFERDRKKVILTSAGRELVDRARRVLLEADALSDAARRTRDPLAGTLKLGVIPTISPYLLPSVTPAIRERHPRLTLVWVEDKTAALVRALESGALDAALLAREAELSNLEVEVIASDPFLLATSKGDVLGAKENEVKASELRDASVLLLDDGHCLREQTVAFCSTTKARELEFRATSLPTLVQMVAAGWGVTLLPRLAAETERRRAELSLRPFAAPAPARTIVLGFRARSPFAAAFEAVAATIREAYPDVSDGSSRPKRPRRAPR